MRQRKMTNYWTDLGKIKLFVIPDGSPEAVSLHMARTVARRTERLAVFVSKQMPMNKYIMIYLNRLSSVLFMQALASNKRLGIVERIWDIKRES